ncbi:MAG: hypothetical protein HMLKMBBP_02009 [Planctomycetes bacterium]|nr:hypothetical protein [Planctomycetota bacterium]
MNESERTGTSARGARPPQFAFVIDHRKCIGCHACTVACKSENDVPLGQFRTWVKYVEKGVFPSARRHFTVLRCNHCDAAPCVEICPVTALHKRKDAIVDLDRDKCIGCRACMQACPYDALYFEEDKGVAEKCHYCAHRTELGLEPACVVVCPERAIVAGDASDPETPISKLIREEQTSRRRLEKGTQPRVWYVDALPEALVPASHVEPPTYLWSDRRTPQPAVPPGFEPPADLVASLDVAHPPQWGWHVWAYLVTKNVAAGAAVASPLLALGGVAAGIVPEVVALVFLIATVALLIHDLGRPERFVRLLLAPNTTSWLVKGGWALTAFGALAFGAMVAKLAGMDGVARALLWANVPVAALTSGYSAFLFRQCRARDLWHSKWMFATLVAEALACGAALALVLPGDAQIAWRLGAFAACVALLALTPLLEAAGLPATDQARRAHAIQAAQAKREAHLMWLLCALILAAGLGRDASLLGVEGLGIAARWLAAGLVALVLLLRGRSFITAGQAVPIS